LRNFGCVICELWIFDWVCPCKLVCRYGCCSNFWELLDWRKILKILWYIIHLIIKVIVKFYEFWSYSFKDMDFLSSLFCFRVKLVRYYFNLWELLDWKKISKNLLSILHNIFQFPTKFNEFLKSTSRVINFWNNSSVLREKKFNNCINLCGA